MLMTRLWPTLLLLTVLNTMSLGDAQLLWSEDLPGEDEIRQAWQRREQFVESARITWNEQQVRPPDVATMPDGETIQIDELNMTTDFYLSFQGSKFRHKREGTVPWAEDSEVSLMSRTSTSVSNGQQHRGLTIDEQTDFPQGSISEADTRSLIMNDITMQPVMFAFRMFEPKMRPMDTSHPFQVARSEVDDKVLYRLDFSGQPPDIQRILMVDPDHDFAIVRYVFKNRGRLRVKVDISYRQDGESGFSVPTGWTSTRLSGTGEVRSAHVAVVTHCTLNPRLEPDEFEITFPHGTLVDDRIANQEYIIREDGTNRRVTSAELRAGIPVERLLETEPGEAFQQPRDGLWNYVFFTTAAIAAAVALFLFAKRIRSI